MRYIHVTFRNEAGVGGPWQQKIITVQMHIQRTICPNGCRRAPLLWHWLFSLWCTADFHFSSTEASGEPAISMQTSAMEIPQLLLDVRQWWQPIESCGEGTLETWLLRLDPPENCLPFIQWQIITVRDAAVIHHCFTFCGFARTPHALRARVQVPKRDRWNCRSYSPLDLTLFHFVSSLFLKSHYNAAPKIGIIPLLSRHEWHSNLAALLLWQSGLITNSRIKHYQ